MECDVFDDSGRTDPFLHRPLRPAPFQTFEYQTGLFRAVAYQFQCFIAYRDDVLGLGFLSDGMDTFSSGSEVDDFLPAKGKNIAEPQAGQFRRLPSDSVSRRTPLPLAVTFPLSGLFRGLHPLEYVRAGRT